MRFLLKRFLEKKGWFLRRINGLSIGTHLPKDLELLYLNKIKLILDVGAHRGESVKHFKQLFPCAQIISFEPVRENFEWLKKNIVGDNHYEAICTAFGSKRGTARIWQRRDSTTWSLEGKLNDGNICSDVSQEVEVDTIDNFIESRGIVSVDLVKLDTEGHEKSVIAGAIESLKNGVIKAMLVETTLISDNKEHVHIDDISNQLLSSGFKLVAIYDQTVWPNPFRMAYCNALFVKTFKAIH